MAYDRGRTGQGASKVVSFRLPLEVYNYLKPSHPNLSSYLRDRITYDVTRKHSKKAADQQHHLHIYANNRGHKTCTICGHTAPRMNNGHQPCANGKSVRLSIRLEMAVYSRLVRNHPDVSAYLRERITRDAERSGRVFDML